MNYSIFIYGERLNDIDVRSYPLEVVVETDMEVRRTKPNKSIIAKNKWNSIYFIIRQLQLGARYERYSVSYEPIITVRISNFQLKLF